jgi:hypothetical protein
MLYQPCLWDGLDFLDLTQAFDFGYDLLRFAMHRKGL